MAREVAEAIGIRAVIAPYVADSMSFAPTLDRAAYRLMGINAGRHAKGSTPEPQRNPYSDEAIEARYHTAVVALVAIERGFCVAGVEPETLVLDESP